MPITSIPRQSRRCDEQTASYDPSALGSQSPEVVSRTANHRSVGSHNDDNEPGRTTCPAEVKIDDSAQMSSPRAGSFVDNEPSGQHDEDELDSKIVTSPCSTKTSDGNMSIDRETQNGGNLPLVQVLQGHTRKKFGPYIDTPPERGKNATFDKMSNDLDDKPEVFGENDQHEPTRRDPKITTRLRTAANDEGSRLDENWPIRAVICLLYTSPSPRDA